MSTGDLQAPSTPDEQRDSNRRLLMGEVQEVKRALEAHTQRNASGRSSLIPVVDAATQRHDPDYRLEHLQRVFGLSSFERSVVALCAGYELDGTIAMLCQEAQEVQGDAGRPFPTLDLALAALPDPHWSILEPQRPLRRWGLISVGATSPLLHSRLTLDERILIFLTGLASLDQGLSELPIRLVASTTTLLPGERPIAARVASMIWPPGDGNAGQPDDESGPKGAGQPVIELTAEDVARAYAVADAAARSMKTEVFALQASDIPADSRERNMFARTWTREFALENRLLLIDANTDRDAARPLISSLVHSMPSAPIVIASRRPGIVTGGRIIPVELPLVDAFERRELWSRALGVEASTAPDDLGRLSWQFRLSSEEIDAAIHDARTTPSADDPLWDAARRQTRSQPGDLATAIVSAASAADLVLPDAELQLLDAIRLQVRHRHTVYGEWRFDDRGRRGLGITALFAGPSGTGKTLAAEIIATELRLNLWRIDLASMVSKYIGETEKNLGHVFDTADAGGAVLLFDEADALFGRRSEVKDSHDRYANIEVSYLLQRIEAFQGLAILTTNMEEALDPAFVRRLRFIVRFPFPDTALRKKIWRRVFPRDKYTDGLDLDALARLNVVGGSIRNIAVQAAFLAAADDTPRSAPVEMRHAVEAARLEFMKLKMPFDQEWLKG